ncbi:TauD/TfdA family dioxygenase [Luteolibacter pohnpeiensis]|uniref:TauD/TfdA family dioxygenase n=1 Tax=Luteolibacter pohnpeiensis TaxID=454153 RepID=A0A934VXS3_9BACT|nr:TauD/TfdA family dioxygenase [Luteolibacter pohnpeiensis]
MKWRDRLDSEGFLICPGFDYEDLLDLAIELGSPVAESSSGDLVRIISPGQTANNSNSLSSRYGMAAFPFHTESAYWRVPPRYLMLHCISPGHGNRPTGYIDTAPRLSSLGAILESAQYRIRRSTGSFLVRCVERTETGIRVRADAECMLPMMKTRDPLNEFLLPGLDDTATWHSWTSNDLLILDNWRMMHGRGSATNLDPDRKLARILVANEH